MTEAYVYGAIGISVALCLEKANLNVRALARGPWGIAEAASLTPDCSWTETLKY